MKKFIDTVKKNKSKIIAWIIAFLIIYISLQSISDYQSDKIEKITYTEFLSLVDEGKVDTVYYSVSDEWMTITLLNDETKDMTREERDEYTGYTNSDKRRVPYPAYDEFRKDILSADTNMKVQTAKADVISILSSLISVVFPILMLLWLFKVMNKQMQGTTKHDVIQTSDIRFDDVIGHEEILDDVKFITELIKDPTIGDKVGAKVPKGILLSGEPGTGKTLIAKAIAGEAGVPFLYQNASSFIEMYVGVGAKRVRELFKIARENSPCIIFIDEIDSIGSKRDSTKGTSENEQTINALLQEMDGFTGREGIFVIAATNRADKLDKALVRSGRFDRQIVVNPPRDWKVRKELFEHYLNKFSVGDDIDIDTISKQVSGFTGADIAMVCNEASIIAVMQKKDYIDTACIEEAIDKKIFKGNRSKKKSHEQDRQIVAYHEAGHAVMNYIVKEPMARATIIGTTSGVGGVVFGEDKDTQFMTDRDFLNRVLICYGGRASEEIKFSSVTTGASNDITQATQLLTQYIERYGFDRDFGLLDVAVLGEEHLLNSTEITNKLSKMSKELYSECLGKLKENYNLVEALATKLLDVETLSGEEIYELFSTVS